MDQFIRCLKQRVPSQYIEIPVDQFLNTENQSIFLEEISTDLESNASYFKPFFKAILRSLESQNLEVIDELYDLYIGKILDSKALSPLDFDELTYYVKPGCPIRIRENPKLISGLNTTGLRTWELSIYLSYYLLNIFLPNNEKFNKVIELGTGTGLVGLSLRKYTDLQVSITDGDAQLVENLATNFKRNGLDVVSDCFQYIWGEDITTEAELCVGADLTYDVSILPALIDSIDRLFKSKVEILLIACTVRNEATLKEFGKLIEERLWKYTVLPQIEVSSMFLRPSADIKLYQIERPDL